MLDQLGKEFLVSLACLRRLCKRITGVKLGELAALAAGSEPGVGRAAVIPNPKRRLLDQVREVMRLDHYSIRTERCCCDWIRRYIKFRRMGSRQALQRAEAKIEQFLMFDGDVFKVADAFPILLSLRGKGLAAPGGRGLRCARIR
jgi:Phage integrase, N-terminal SAM-like domain